LKTQFVLTSGLNTSVVPLKMYFKHSEFYLKSTYIGISIFSKIFILKNYPLYGIIVFKADTFSMIHCSWEANGVYRICLLYVLRDRDICMYLEYEVTWCNLDGVWLIVTRTLGWWLHVSNI